MRMDVDPEGISVSAYLIKRPGMTFSDKIGPAEVTANVRVEADEPRGANLETRAVL
jgi:hypothetical protein